jgi:translation initiation factor 1
MSATSQKKWNFVAKLRIEKQGRGGKTVTFVDNLPKMEIYLKEWTRDWKGRCGSGGTYRTDGKDGSIEIQGDKRELLRKILTEMGISFKG